MLLKGFEVQRISLNEALLSAVQHRVFFLLTIFMAVNDLKLDKKYLSSSSICSRWMYLAGSSDVEISKSFKFDA